VSGAQAYFTGAIVSFGSETGAYGYFIYGSRPDLENCADYTAVCGISEETYKYPGTRLMQTTIVGGAAFGWNSPLWYKYCVRLERTPPEADVHVCGDSYQVIIGNFVPPGPEPTPTGTLSIETFREGAYLSGYTTTFTGLITSFGSEPYVHGYFRYGNRPDLENCGDGGISCQIVAYPPYPPGMYKLPTTVWMQDTTFNYGGSLGQSLWFQYCVETSGSIEICGASVSVPIGVPTPTPTPP
jgi:hypothetical protein